MTQRGQNEVLKGCPFCGSPAEFRWCGGVLLAECIECGASKGDGGNVEPVPMGDGREFHRAAAANWNRRADSAAQPSEEIAHLLRFYNVATIEEVVRIQSERIDRLIAKLQPSPDTQPYNYRQG